MFLGNWQTQLKHSIADLAAIFSLLLFQECLIWLASRGFEFCISGAQAVIKTLTRKFGLMSDYRLMQIEKQLMSVARYLRKDALDVCAHLHVCQHFPIFPESNMMHQDVRLSQCCGTALVCIAVR